MSRRGFRNNNPGNIRPDPRWKWIGQIAVDPEGYIVFDSDLNGIRAIGIDLLTKMERAVDTVREIITAYAPPSENDTESYISAVKADLGVQDNDILSLNHRDMLVRFMRAIIKHENGSCPYSEELLNEAADLALSACSLKRE